MEARSCESEALTESDIGSERCQNPFCGCLIPPKGKNAPVKKYCSDRCRMDAYVLRRAGELMSRVGVVRFFNVVEAHDRS